MTAIDALEAEAHLDGLLDRVASGEVITIAWNGTPIARLVPISKPATMEERMASMERLKETRKGITLGGLSIRDLIDEGRR